MARRRVDFQTHMHNALVILLVGATSWGAFRLVDSYKVEAELAKDLDALKAWRASAERACECSPARPGHE